MASARLLLLLTLGVCGCLAQQLTLFNITQPVNGLSSTCTSVLNQALACDPWLLHISTGDWVSDDVLTSVCTTTCTTAWTTYIRRVTGACGTSRYDGGNGFLYLPVTNIEPVYEKYQLLCLKNTAGKYCNAVIQDILKIDPDAQTRSSAAPAPGMSTQCSWRTELEH